MNMNEKKELQVAALRNGTVIDHIPSDKLFTVVAMLHLDEVTANITIGNNLESKKLGRNATTRSASPTTSRCRPGSTWWTRKRDC